MSSENIRNNTWSTQYFFAFLLLSMQYASAGIHKIVSSHSKFENIKKELKILHAPTVKISGQIEQLLPTIDAKKSAQCLFIAGLMVDNQEVYYLFNNNKNVERLFEKLKTRTNAQSISWYYLENAHEYAHVTCGSSSHVFLFKLPDKECDRILEKKFNDMIRKTKY